VVTTFVVVAADVARTILVLIAFDVSAGVADTVATILVCIGFVVGACATKVNERFIRHCEVLFRSHGLERNAMDEDN
jgi:hypothetical protein